MKKVIYLFAVIISLALMNISCTKPAEDTPDVKTLAQQYPNWKNLYWISTNGLTFTDMYPKLNISINDNYSEAGKTISVVIVNGIDRIEHNGIVVIAEYNLFYKKVTLTSTSIIFSEPTIGNTAREYTIISPFNTKGEITLKYLNDTYVLSK